MLIRVIYKNNSSGMVKDHLLDELIKSGEIVAFHRSSGWATIGRDPVRGKSSPYNGPERRKRRKPHSQATEELR